MTRADLLRALDAICPRLGLRRRDHAADHTEWRAAAVGQPFVSLTGTTVTLEAGVSVEFIELDAPEVPADLVASLRAAFVTLDSYSAGRRRREREAFAGPIVALDDLTAEQAGELRGAA